MNRVCSIFAQMLDLFPRGEFEAAVQKHRAERHARGFTSWGQFIAMMFCQLGNAKSLREICQGLAASEGKLRHLGVPEAPARSTLAYANEHRPWELYQTVFHQLLGKCQALAKGEKRKFRFKNKLMSLDASVIDLCAEVFDWAKFKQTKGAVKLHLLLDHQGYLPSYAVITEGGMHEIRVARQMRFEPETVLVFDRGYTDYEWFRELTAKRVWLVTRMKDNADYGVLEERALPANPGGVRRDEVIFLYKLEKESEPARCYMRRIEYWDQTQERLLVFLTNNLKLAASTVAAVYKDRWQIELLFKALKQSLRVKTFVGTSANALKTQIWTALIALLAIKYLQMKARFRWSLSNLVALLRQQLFVYRDMWAWLNEPFHAPPAVAASQLSLEI
ncbi:MAG TPA: IS4 family transposase [Candidatus Angelobacter sp.]